MPSLVRLPSFLPRFKSSAAPETNFELLLVLQTCIDLFDHLFFSGSLSHDMIRLKTDLSVCQRMPDTLGATRIQGQYPNICAEIIITPGIVPMNTTATEKEKRLLDCVGMLLHEMLPAYCSLHVCRCDRNGCRGYLFDTSLLGITVHGLC